MTDLRLKDEDYYTEPYGISWIYRGIKSDEKRKELLGNEPYSKEITEQFNNLIRK